MQGTTINIDSQKNQNITINRNIDSIPTLYKDRSFNNFKAPGSLADKKKVCIDFALNKLNKKSQTPKENRNCHVRAGPSATDRGGRRSRGGGVLVAG